MIVAQVTGSGREQAAEILSTAQWQLQVFCVILIILIIMMPIAMIMIMKTTQWQLQVVYDLDESMTRYHSYIYLSIGQAALSRYFDETVTPYRSSKH